MAITKVERYSTVYRIITPKNKNSFLTIEKIVFITVLSGTVTFRRK